MGKAFDRGPMPRHTARCRQVMVVLLVSLLSILVTRSIEPYLRGGLTEWFEVESITGDLGPDDKPCRESWACGRGESTSSETEPLHKVDVEVREVDPSNTSMEAWKPDRNYGETATKKLNDGGDSEHQYGQIQERAKESVFVKTTNVSSFVSKNASKKISGTEDSEVDNVLTLALASDDLESDIGESHLSNDTDYPSISANSTTETIGKESTEFVLREAVGSVATAEMGDENNYSSEGSENKTSSIASRRDESAKLASPLLSNSQGPSNKSLIDSHGVSIAEDDNATVSLSTEIKNSANTTREVEGLEGTKEPTGVRFELNTGESKLTTNKNFSPLQVVTELLEKNSTYRAEKALQAPVLVEQIAPLKLYNVPKRNYSFIPESVKESMKKFESPACRAIRYGPSGSALEGTVGISSRAKCSSSMEGTEEALVERGSQILISEAYKLIYVSNMKAASQTLSIVMRERLKAITIGSHKINTYIEQRRAVEPFVKLEDYFVFTFVRDPLSMFYSAYAEIDRRMDRFLKKRTSFQLINRTMKNEPNRILNCLDMVRTGSHLRSDLTPAHMYSQVWKTQRCPDGVGNFLEFDFIGKLENIREDYYALESIIGAKHRPLRIFNGNKQSMYKKHLYNLRTAAFENLEKKACAYSEADYTCFTYQKPTTCQA